VTLVGIDVGGTFTDAVLVDDAGRLTIVKIRTRPDDIAAGFVEALTTICARAGTSLTAVRYLAHGTTTATNAIVQRRFARTGLVTNSGFSDVLEIGTQQRPHVYDLWTPQPRPIVARRDAIGVDGRIGPDGSELAALDSDAVERAARVFAEGGVEAVAIVFLHAYANATHEHQAAAVFARVAPSIAVSESCRVAPEFREYLRASTTTLNAALLPRVGGYIRTLAARAATVGVQVPVHLMQSNGGVATTDTAARLPVALAASGPAAGVIGSARAGMLVHEPDVLTFDMGGTTADVALVIGGRPQLRFTADQAGYPVNVPQIDVLSIGAGGGSIARVDRYGALSVGPQSAGADPGPAAYGRGGRDATVTDAHLVLGTLDRHRRLGTSQTRLDADLAARAVSDAVAAPLATSLQDAAAAVVRVANATMAQALRLVSVARGHDPRGMALVAIGGAGPMHACDIADELAISRVVIPRYPGITAAVGLLASDIQHDARLSYLRASRDANLDELQAYFARLADDARRFVAASAHGADATITADVDMRYHGQAYNLTVPFTLPVTAAGLRAAEDAFHTAHRDAYDYTPSVTDTQIVTLRVRASAPPPRIDWASSGPATTTATTGRGVWRDGRFVQHAVYQRDTLTRGAVITGPCLVEQEDATTIIPAGWAGRVAAGGTLVVRRGAADA
jgi:N-methylhydantoinase A